MTAASKSCLLGIAIKYADDLELLMINDGSVLELAAWDCDQLRQ